jgi:hypothetical protein
MAESESVEEQQAMSMETDDIDSRISDDSGPDSGETGEDKFVVSLVVTEEQRLAVRAFFGHNDWDYEYEETKREDNQDNQDNRNDDDDNILMPGYIIQQNYRMQMQRSVQTVCAGHVSQTMITGSFGGRMRPNQLMQGTVLPGKACTSAFGQCFSTG